MRVAPVALPAVVAAAALLVSACGGGDDADPSAFPTMSQTPTPTAEVAPTTEPAGTGESASTNTPNPASTGSWDPVLYPDDPNGPKYITDTIDLKVGDPITLPLVDGVTIAQEDGGVLPEDVNGFGTECLASTADDPWTQEIGNQAAENGPYWQGVVFFAKCPAVINYSLSDPDIEDPAAALLHTYTITITE